MSYSYSENGLNIFNQISKNSSRRYTALLGQKIAPDRKSRAEILLDCGIRRLVREIRFILKGAKR